jgi:hypothetical protein
MNETSLLALREDPRPEFAARLLASLRAADEKAVRAPAARPRRVLPLAASLAAAAAFAALFALPSVRASAASLLARFRLVHFVAVEVDQSRLAELRSREIDLPAMIGERVRVVQEPGPPQAAASPREAGAAVGIDIRVPEWLPPDVTLRETFYRGPGRVEVVADAGRLAHLLDFLGIDDVRVPAGLDGQTATIEVPAIVRLRYANDKGAQADFLQARSPELVLPEGVAVEALAEIGLRILGFEAAEAKRFAHAVDWRSTMLVPLPSGKAGYRRIEVDGNPGLVIERTPVAKDGAPATRPIQIVLWSADGMVFALRGNFQSESVLRMAYSTR